MHQFFQILSVGKCCNRRTQYSLYDFPFLVSKIEESSTRWKISSNEGYPRVLRKNKTKPKPKKNKFMFRVLLLNGLNLTMQLEDVIHRVCKDF